MLSDVAGTQPAKVVLRLVSTRRRWRSFWALSSSQLGGTATSLDTSQGGRAEAFTSMPRLLSIVGAVPAPAAGLQTAPES